MKLGVNIDHSATLRQARYKDCNFDSSLIIEPNVLEIAKESLAGGADSITMHLREDRRHIIERDVLAVRKLDCKLNLEMACTSDMTEFALKIKPDYVCLVPENRQEVTTEGGLDIVGNFERVKEIATALGNVGIIVSLFIDPELEQINASQETSAKTIELHTGAYANAWGIVDKFEAEKNRISKAFDFAQSKGICVNAGHGLNYDNILDFKKIANFNELNIGHSIISRALFMGMKNAVSEMKSLILK